MACGHPREGLLVLLGLHCQQVHKVPRYEHGTASQNEDITNRTDEIIGNKTRKPTRMTYDFHILQPISLVLFGVPIAKPASVWAAFKLSFVLSSDLGRFCWIAAAALYEMFLDTSFALSKHLVRPRGNAQQSNSWVLSTLGIARVQLGKRLLPYLVLVLHLPSSITASRALALWWYEEPGLTSHSPSGPNLILASKQRGFVCLPGNHVYSK